LRAGPVDTPFEIARFEAIDLMNAILKIATDAAGITRVCGPFVAAKWLGQVVVNFPAVLDSKNLQSADKAMGSGPFRATRAKSRAILTGTQVFSALREIWVRDVYLKDDFLSVPEDGLVIDLGANQGIFAALVLAQNESVRVIAVEPSVRLLDSLKKCIAANGWSERITPIRGFIGTFTETQQAALRQEADYFDAPTITEAELIARCGIDKVDLLKCDIEGSEFFLLEPESRLLAMTDRLAIELHKWGGDIERFLSHLALTGFEIGHVEWAHGSCIALCRRKVPAAPSSYTTVAHA
jgi:FkbM family methyltransferase